MKRTPPVVRIVIEPTHGLGQEALMAVINQLIDQALAKQAQESKEQAS